jgi:RNA polymerase sigma-70 factor (ECF subfamily)
VTTPAEPSDALARAISGDETAFASVVGPYERSLFRHCYRMLGSGPDAEDAVQDTLVRAWRRLESFEAAGALGGWLYRIATNVCLDMLRSRRARADPIRPGPSTPPGTMPAPPDLEMSWVEPVGDEHLDLTEDPGEQIVRREEISLAFVAALQRLTPRQRACLLLHDVLGFSQNEVADALEISLASVNSLLFRARQSAGPRADRAVLDRSDPRLDELVERYVRAWQLADMSAFLELVTDDIRLSMPPMVEWYDGREAVALFVENAIFAHARPHGILLRPGWCNGQPAFAVYEPDGRGDLVAGGLQVLEVVEQSGRATVTDIVSYRDPLLVTRCGFPGRADGR